MIKFIVRLIIGVWLLIDFVECSKQVKEDTPAAKPEVFNLDSTVISFSQSSKDTSELILKADLMYATDQYADAIELYTKLLLIDSLNGKFNYRKGFCLRNLRLYPESIEYFLKSIALNYREFDSYNNLGVIYSIGLNDYPQARKYFEKSLEINPNSEEVKSFLKTIDANEEKKL